MFFAIMSLLNYIGGRTRPSMRVAAIRGGDKRRKFLRGKNSQLKNGEVVFQPIAPSRPPRHLPNCPG